MIATTLTLLGFLPLVQTSASSATQGTVSASAADRLAELERANAELSRRLDLLADEMERQDHGDVFTPVGESRRGLSPAASKIYEAKSRLSIGGYGEMLYTNRQSGTAPDDVDFLRAILYVGYKFDDRWLLNTEFEFEHASVEDTADGDSNGSVSVEFAYLEYLFSEEFSVRAGLLLVPMGFVNELHEPTTFWSANRPEIERLILPSTWRENGVGVVGEGEDLSYRAYVINGLDGEGFSSSGLRGGRQKGSEAKIEDAAFVGRLDYVGLDDLLFGASLYHGNSGQGLDGAGSVGTTIVDLHAEYNWHGLRARALGVHATLDDVEDLNDALGLVGNQSVGEELSGYYVELGYDVLNGSGSKHALIPFVRYEKYDTQAKVPGGFSSNPARDAENFTFGVAWKPTSQVIFKADYVDADNEAGSGQDLLRLAMGYIF